MASSKVDACIFCGLVPCECNKKPAKKAARAKPPKPELPPEEKKPASNHLDKIRAAASAAPKREPIPEPTAKKIVTEISEDDIIFNAAVRNLGPLLCEEDRQQWAGVITSPPHPDEVKIMWKSRRKDET